MTRGFTLIEVVVALVVLEIAVVAVAGTLAIAARQLTQAEHLERAVVEAEGVLDSLSGVAAPVGGSRAFSGGAVQWTVDTFGIVRLHVSDPAGAVRLAVNSAVPAP